MYNKIIPAFALTTFLGLSTISQTNGAVNPADIKGYKFFDSVTGEEIVIRGVDYYPRPNKGDLNFNSMDYYTEEHRHIWERDIPYFQELGVNAIRLYAVDAKENHDAFMCALESAGIYVIVALAHDCPTCAITRDQAPDCYPPELKEQGQQVINAFSKYSNTLAFSAGNEVNHFTPLDHPEWNAPCQKKFIRDMREYVASCSTHSMRKIPVGLVLADTDREKNAMYYNCKGEVEEDDEFETAEWYGLNSYVYCNGKAETYDEALGFKSLQKDFESYKYSIPVLLTEFGCLSNTFPSLDGYEGQRNFNQAKWMLERPELRNLFSGGFAFEYSMEKSNAANESPYPFVKFGHQSYGIGYFEPEDCDDVTIPCEYQPLPSFDTLKQVYTESNIANITNLDDFVIEPDRQGYSQCPQDFPSIGSFEWEADKTPFLHCPSKRESSSFTCSSSSSRASSLFGINVGREDDDDNNNDHDWSYYFPTWLIIVLILIAYVGWKGYSKARTAGASSRSSSGRRAAVMGKHQDIDEEEASSTDDSEFSSSDESSGLLLTLSKNNNNNNNNKFSSSSPFESETPYQSISPESSSENLSKKAFA